MLQKDFSYTENISKENQLSVVIMADSFFYGIFDTQGVLIAHQSFKNVTYSVESTQTILSDPNLQNAFAKIGIVSIAAHSHQLAVSEDALINSMPMLVWKEIFKEKLPAQDVVNYFGITAAQHDLMVKLFAPQDYAIHDLLFLLTTYYIGIEDSCVHLHFEDHLISIFIQREGKLHFYNTFRFISEKDILYFVLASMEYAALDPKVSQVNVSGWIDQKSPIFQTLESYIKNINIIQDRDFDILQRKDLNSSNYFIHFINRICAS